MTTRYAIVGAGMMGREHIRNIALLPDTAVTAIAEPDDTQADLSLAAAGPGCVRHRDHRALIATGDIDAVVVAAPNHLHLPVLRDLLATDLPVLCEKPLGLTDTECAEIERLAHARRAPVWVAMEYRYMPAIARLLAEAAAGTAGPLRMVSIREHRFPFLPKVGDWNRFAATSGGTLVEKCCHFFDLMRLILRSDPLRIYASGAMDVNFLDERYDGRTPDVIDNAFVVVDFASGARGMLDLCMFAEGAPWQEEISATGPRARLDARVPGPPRFEPDGRARAMEFTLCPRDTMLPVTERLEVDPRILDAGDHHGSTFYQHERFLAMLRGGGTPPEVGIRDGRIAVAMGAAAEESARTGLPVTLATGRDIPDPPAEGAHA